MVDQESISLSDLRIDRAVYHAWNEGDIAKEEGRPEDTNPYDIDEEPLLWRTWRRGWHGTTLAVNIPTQKGTPCTSDQAPPAATPSASRQCESDGSSAGSAPSAVSGHRAR